MDDLKVLRDFYGETTADPWSQARVRARLGERPSARRPWALGGLGLVAAATAAALLVSNTGTEPAQELAGNKILLMAAAKVEKSSAAGKYWHYQVMIGADLANKGYVVRSKGTDDWWIPATAEDKPRRIQENLGATFPTPADKKAWEAAGSPKTWKLGPDTITLDPEPRRVLRDSLNFPKGTVGSFAGTWVTRADLAGLPTDPAKLEKLIRAGLDKSEGPGPAGKPFRQQRVFEAGTHLILRLPSSAKVRAAAYRMLAGLSGVRSLGLTRDALGREGQAVAFPTESGAERRLIVDAQTGMPLAEEYVNPKSEISLTYQDVLKAEWTDQEPKLP